jgi:hypothetical protein
LVRLRIITTTWKIRLLVAPFASNSDSLYWKEITTNQILSLITSYFWSS